MSRARSAIEVTDGYTLVTHQVNDGAIALGRSVGRYRALCGDLVLAASLAELRPRCWGYRCALCAGRPTAALRCSRVHVML
ncbi:MAG: hypothetical protein M3Y48_16860 [Actinomycetota bacterium]|nr:hypothetical protein [Actinomycetota bacterium]